MVQIMLYSLILHRNLMGVILVLVQMRLFHGGRYRVLLKLSRYASIRAIEAKSPVDDQQWLAYWVLYSMITLFELTFAKLLEWNKMSEASFFLCMRADSFTRIPLWPYAKLILTCWLVLPYFSGAAYVYEHYVSPFFVNPQTINIWYVPNKKDSSKPDDIITTAEKYIQKNGTEAFENLIRRADKSRRNGCSST